MPQVFQVIKCYKCCIFQVHQTKKDNKWKCKVCGEKQSVKRHYGIGTAKDCRIHVQKLNNMQGDVEESKLKAIYSENSDHEDNLENVDKINITHKQVADNARKKSKWSTYIEKEEISVIQEPEYLDCVEVCLELPQKRKINRKSKQFKIPKVSDECNKTEIIHETIEKSPVLNSEEITTYNHIYYSSDFNDKRSPSNKPYWSKEKMEVVNKSKSFQTNRASKWAHYIAHDKIETNDQYGFVENDQNHIEKKSVHYDDNRAENENINNYHEKVCYQPNMMDNIENGNHFRETKDKLVTSKIIFSLCDDNDLDNILEF